MLYEINIYLRLAYALLNPIIWKNCHKILTGCRHQNKKKNPLTFQIHPQQLHLNLIISFNLLYLRKLNSMVREYAYTQHYTIALMYMHNKQKPRNCSINNFNFSEACLLSVNMRPRIIQWICSCFKVNLQ